MDVSLILLITLNVIAVVFESVDVYAARYGPWFQAFEVFSVIVFTIEYLARVWSVVDRPERDPNSSLFWTRVRFMCSPMALIDLAVILPFYLAFYIGIDLRFMRVLRLLRVFKLTRYSAAMTLLMTVLRREAQSIGAALFVLLLLIVLAASLTYIAEHDAQPENFSSIPAAMWWAVITMTTVGYGDVIPMTVAGKFFAASISILSMGMVALPAGILASGFMEALRERREQFAELVEEAMEDGVIDAQEEELLHHIRQRLGMSAEEAEQILRRSQRDQERREADLAFIAEVETAYAAGYVSEAEARAMEEAGLALGMGHKEVKQCLAIFDKHLKHRRCPSCGGKLGVRSAQD